MLLQCVPVGWKYKFFTIYIYYFSSLTHILSVFSISVSFKVFQTSCDSFEDAGVHGRR